MWPAAVRSYFRARRGASGADDEATLVQFRRYEAGLVVNFRREALLLTGRVPRDDWQWLAVAQHYGPPTRLLDWPKPARGALFRGLASARRTCPRVRLRSGHGRRRGRDDRRGVAGFPEPFRIRRGDRGVRVRRHQQAHGGAGRRVHDPGRSAPRHPLGCGVAASSARYRFGRTDRNPHRPLPSRNLRLHSVPRSSGAGRDAAPGARRIRAGAFGRGGRARTVARRRITPFG
ncbi:MAG: FRG domain-containing protein [Rhodospirillales bacterium]|nr:FRG domain-containing protein [Rhodospirillales bacterium]